MSFTGINEKVGKYRWTICSLVFFATTVNYFDRSVLGLLKPTLSEAEFLELIKVIRSYTIHGCNEFSNCLCIRHDTCRKIHRLDRNKKRLYIFLLGWSIAAIGHALAHNTFTFGAWRAALGFTEAGNFPAANKTMAVWFPKKRELMPLAFTIPALI